jgi:hypothetical protein
MVPPVMAERIGNLAGRYEATGQDRDARSNVLDVQRPPRFLQRLMGLFMQSGSALLHVDLVAWAHEAQKLPQPRQALFDGLR